MFTPAFISQMVTCLQQVLASCMERDSDSDDVSHDTMHAGDASTGVKLAREVDQRGDAAQLGSLRQLQSALAHEKGMRSACESKASDESISAATFYGPHRSRLSTASSSTLRTQQAGDELPSASTKTATHMSGEKRKFTGVEISIGRGQPIKKPRMDRMLNIRAHCSRIPLPRSMDRIPQVNVAIFSGDKLPTIFTGEGLRTILGGNPKNHYVTVGPSATALAKELQIRTYLLLDAEQHPWLPTGTGKHRYCFISSSFNYVGKYRAQRVGELSVKEWAALPERFHELYGKKLKAMGHSDHTIEELIDLCNVGTLHVPCIRLECIEFDPGCYERLSDAHHTVTAQGAAGGCCAKRQKKSSRCDRRYDSDIETIESEDD
ncbi:hypothetical protein C8T65DRAFT_650487 [Cerioporus squamosus]|nr:hypothetical protein C8T65DRAFT_650487 [Cerioporus squamosus]